MIHPPTSIRASGQKYWKTFRMYPCVCKKRSTPTRMRALPQKILSRFILTSISTSVAKKATKQNIQAQEDEDDCHSVITQDGKTAEECCEDQEQHRANDNEIQSMCEISSGVFTKQTSQDSAYPNKARDQRPHVRPGSKIMGLILIEQNPADPGDDGGWDRHTRRAGQQSNDEHEQSCAYCPHRPGEIMINPVLY